MSDAFDEAPGASRLDVYGYYIHVCDAGCCYVKASAHAVTGLIVSTKGPPFAIKGRAERE
jgi:hypothetical protein